MSNFRFDHVCIIGLGQMGASLGLAMKRGGLIGTICGYDVHSEHSKTALAMNAIDRTAESASEAVSDADLVVLCTPVGTYASIMNDIAPHLKTDVTLTDIGSIKAQAIRDVAPHLNSGIRYIPSHPIAGSEKVGPYHAHAEFFERHLFLITPIEGTPPEWLEPIAELWHSLGAAVDLLTPDLHDQIYAYMSHLPQLIAYAAMPTLNHEPVILREQDLLFRRFIRIGRSDPYMWRDVFLENNEYVLAAGRNLHAIISHMRDELLLGGANETVDALDIPVEHICKTLWPRLIASAMITSVQLFEEQMQMKLARYAAGGFTDVACPVVESTDEDFTAISNHPSYVIKLLGAFLKQLESLMHAIEDKDTAHLLNLLSECQAQGMKLSEDGVLIGS